MHAIHPSKLSEDELRRTLEQVGYTYRDPEKVRSFEDEEAELRTARYRLLAAGVFTGLTALLMLLGMEPFWTVLEHPFLMWVMFAMALETMFVTAWFVKKMAWASLRRGILNQPRRSAAPGPARLRPPLERREPSSMVDLGEIPLRSTIDAGRGRAGGHRHLRPACGRPLIASGSSPPGGPQPKDHPVLRVDWLPAGS